MGKLPPPFPWDAATEARIRREVASYPPLWAQLLQLICVVIGLVALGVVLTLWLYSS